VDRAGGPARHGIRIGGRDSGGRVEVIVDIVPVRHRGAGEVLPRVDVPETVRGEERIVFLAGRLHRVVGGRNPARQPRTELARENPSGARERLAQGREPEGGLLVELGVQAVRLGRVEIVDSQVLGRVYAAAVRGV